MMICTNRVMSIKQTITTLNEKIPIKRSLVDGARSSAAQAKLHTLDRLRKLNETIFEATRGGHMTHCPNSLVNVRVTEATPTYLDTRSNALAPCSLFIC